MFLKRREPKEKVDLMEGTGASLLKEINSLDMKDDNLNTSKSGVPTEEFTQAYFSS